MKQLLRRFALLCCITFSSWSISHAAITAPGWSHTYPAGAYQRAYSPDQRMLEHVKAANQLEGAVGWFEYDVTVPASGWYELIVNGYAEDIEIAIDMRDSAIEKAAAYVPGSRGFNGKDDKVGNFWLAEGTHLIRLQRLFWTGFRTISGITLQAASDDRAATSVRVARTVAYGSYRKNECGTLDIQYGPRTRNGGINVGWVNAATTRGIRTFAVPLPAVGRMTTIKWPIPCNTAGEFSLYFGDGKSTNRDIEPFDYEVFDTHAAPQRVGEPLRKTLVTTIDCAATPPDYASGGETRVVRKSYGAYRESGDSGWLDGRHTNISQPSWFAYVLKDVAPQQPYLVEVDYPDDADRTFAIALREADPWSYPVAGGVDSGGEFALTHRLQTHTLLFWPRSRDPRIVFFSAKDDTRAAAARIRVYRVDEPLPPLVPPATHGRRFANWYEEGTNFLGMYGTPGDTPHGTHIALERWAQAIAYMGGDTLWPTVAIYNFALYPSRYNVHFSQPSGPDLLRRVLLTAEEHGLKVIPELHPRADELAWPYAQRLEPKRNQLRSKDGHTHDDLPPFYNPLYPENQTWYVKMIGELTDRYRDSPALDGVSLRFMQWKNPTLDNFQSLDWGYDDYTMGLFEKESGIRLPYSAEANRYEMRYRWLMSHAREQWIAWRCRKIAELVTRIRDRVRQSRPDLKVYLPVFPMTEAGSTYNSGTAWLREAGFDPRLLSRIDGVALVNALHSYGRRGNEATNALLRTNLTNASILRALPSADQRFRFLPNAAYFEANDSLAPPTQLGFPPQTKKTWMSAVVNPAGRNYLERYARMLAETDAVMLGDGGNAYTVGQPELREFLNEYRRLPPAAFQRRSDRNAPVAVWELQRDSDYFFYVVNRTPQSSEIDLALIGSGAVMRLSTGKQVALQDNVLQLKLQPYQLVAFHGGSSRRISRVSAP